MSILMVDMFQAGEARERVKFTVRLFNSVISTPSANNKGETSFTTALAVPKPASNPDAGTAITLHPGTHIPAIRDTGISVALVLDELRRRDVNEVASALGITRIDVINCLLLAANHFEKLREWNLPELNHELDYLREMAGWEALSDEALYETEHG